MGRGLGTGCGWGGAASDTCLVKLALSDAALSDAALSDAALSDAALSDAALSDEIAGWSLLEKWAAICTSGNSH
ncbi:MAG: hypothetical protein QF408_05040 [Pirellulales bacterium]|nr:hypothetical protein [Pirellulales bacterium]